MRPKTWNAILFSGLVVGMVGCLLPWGKHNPTLFNGWQDVKVGIEIFPRAVGIYTFASLVFATAFQSVFITKKSPYALLAMLATTLIALFASGVWINEPVANEYSPDGTCTVLYGAYVTLLSTVVVSATAFLYLVAIVERQVRAGNKSSP